MPKNSKTLCVDDLRHAEYYGMQALDFECMASCVVVEKNNLTHCASLLIPADAPCNGVSAILNIENDRGNPKFEVLCQIIAYLHIPADRIFHPDTATDGLKKQKLLLMLQECDEQEAAEILPAIEYLLALIHKRGNSNE